jgi:beta-lactamase regulating signal transducer with metallopeptidase domain
MNGGLLETMTVGGSIFLLWHVLTLTLSLTGLLIERALRKGNPHVRSALLRVTLVLALAVPVACSIWNKLPASSANMITSNQVASEPASDPQPSLPPIDWDHVAVWRPVIADLDQYQNRLLTATQSGFPILQISYAVFLGISFLVSLTLLIRFSIALIRCDTLRRRGRPAGETEKDKCHALAAMMKVTAPPVFQVSGLEGPLLLGFFNPVILMPDGVQARDEVYGHELTHLKRHDMWWHLFARLTTILMPLQPGFWFLKSALERADEDVCDDMVLVHGANRSAYAQLLLNVAESQHAPFPDLCLPMAAFRSKLERRLLRLMDATRPVADRISYLSLSLGLGPLLIVGILTGVIAMAITSVEAQTSPPSKLADVPVAAPVPPIPEAVFAQPITMKEVGGNPPTKLYYQGGNLILQQELNVSPGSIGQIVFYKHMEVVVDEGGGSPSSSMREILPNDFDIRIQSIAADSVSPAKLRILDSSQEIISEFFIDKIGVMRPVTKAEHDADLALRKEKLTPPKASSDTTASPATAVAATTTSEAQTSPTDSLPPWLSPEQRRTVAIVDKHPIFEVTVEQQSAYEEKLLKANYSGDDLNRRVADKRQNVLKALIDRQLIIDDFKAQGGFIPRSFLDARIDDIVKDQYGGDRDAFLKTLADRYTTLEKYREEIENNAVVGYMRNKNVVAHLSDYYQDNLDLFPADEQINATLIAIWNNVQQQGNQPNSKYLLAQQVLNQVNKGTDFLELAKKYNEDASRPTTRWFAKDGPSSVYGSQQAWRIIEKLQPGQTSGIIETKDGEWVYLIAKVNSRRPARIASTEETTKQKQALIDAEVKKLQEAWLGSLRAKAQIQTFL